MDEFGKHKRKLLINMAIFLVLALLSVFLIIDGAVSFKQQWNVISLLLIVLIEIPVIASTVLLALRIINALVNEAKSNKILQVAELDNYEKEVEEKAKEAEDLTFNINRLTADVGKHDNWELFGVDLLKCVSSQLEIVTGMVYKYFQEEDTYKVAATYAYYSDNKPSDFKTGEGLSGQVAKDNKAIFLSEIPEGYVDVVSGLGKHNPNNLVIMPIYKNNKVIGVVELASFKKFGDSFIRRIADISESFGNLAPMI